MYVVDQQIEEKKLDQQLQKLEDLKKEIDMVKFFSLMYVCVNKGVTRVSKLLYC